MSILDKLTGKAKQAAGDIADDPSLRRQGRTEEQKGDAKERLDRADERADEEAERVADLERRPFRYAVLIPASFAGPGRGSEIA
jgi:uncharacterized protein YjbJ (UPF0337 family)